MCTIAIVSIETRRWMTALRIESNFPHSIDGTEVPKFTLLSPFRKLFSQPVAPGVRLWPTGVRQQRARGMKR